MLNEIESAILYGTNESLIVDKRVDNDGELAISMSVPSHDFDFTTTWINKEHAMELIQHLTKSFNLSRDLCVTSPSERVKELEQKCDRLENQLRTNVTNDIKNALGCTSDEVKEAVNEYINIVLRGDNDFKSVSRVCLKSNC